MTEMEPRTLWSEVSGGPGAATAYQQRFDDLAAKGMDIHGEAAFVASLLAAPARVLDAGCGTGRVAIQLTALGYHCTGVDADPTMIDVAEQRDPSTTWVRQDLSRLQLRSQAFELAVLAGNVIPPWRPAPCSPPPSGWPRTCSPADCSSRASGWTSHTSRRGAPLHPWTTTTGHARSPA